MMGRRVTHRSSTNSITTLGRSRGALVATPCWTPIKATKTHEITMLSCILLFSIVNISSPLHASENVSEVRSDQIVPVILRTGCRGFRRFFFRRAGICFFLYHHRDLSETMTSPELSESNENCDRLINQARGWG